MGCLLLKSLILKDLYVKYLRMCELGNAGEEERPPGLKPRLISERSRGPEGPLFHGDTDICDFFRKL